MINYPTEGKFCNTKCLSHETR